MRRKARGCHDDDDDDDDDDVREQEAMNVAERVRALGEAGGGGGSVNKKGCNIHQNQTANPTSNTQNTTLKP